MRNCLVGALLFLCTTMTAHAGEYFREKWFDYPDPTSAPKVTARCVQYGSAHVPCPIFPSDMTRMCLKSACTGHAYDTELLRVSPTFVVSGPDTAEAAVKNAVEAIVAVCAAQAVAGAKAAGAATPSPEPASRIAAAISTGVIAFKVCVGTASATTVVAGIVNQLEFKLETPTHWAKL